MNALARLALIAVALSGASALACSCARQTSFFPPSGAVVPTNVVFQVTQNMQSVPTLTLILEGPETEVALEVITHHDLWVTLRPKSPLTPRASYRLGNGEVVARYVVGDGPDETPPATRTLRQTTRNFFARGGSTCGDFESVQLVVDELGTEPETAFLVFSGETTTAKSLQGDPSAFTESGLLVNGSCDTNFRLQRMPDLALAVRVVDFAGNVSELSEVKQAKSAGCSAAPGLLGLLGVVVFARRVRASRRAR